MSLFLPSSESDTMRPLSAGVSLAEVFILVSIGFVILSLYILVRNPAQDLPEAKNAARWSAVNQLSGAMHRYLAEHNGVYPVVIPIGESAVCRGGMSCQGVDLSFLVPTYLPSLPVDSAARDVTLTGYVVVRPDMDHIGVRASLASGEEIFLIDR